MMTEKEMRSLKRADLLHIWAEQKKELELVRSNIHKMQQNLEDDRIILENPGNVMKSALQINDIFQSAQLESKQSLERIKNVAERQNKELQDKENKITKWCELKQKETKEICSAMLEETKQKCVRFEKETRMQCVAREKDALKDVEVHWEEITEKLETFYEAHRGLRKLIDVTSEVQN